MRRQKERSPRRSFEFRTFFYAITAETEPVGSMNSPCSGFPISHFSLTFKTLFLPPNSIMCTSPSKLTNKYASKNRPTGSKEERRVLKCRIMPFFAVLTQSIFFVVSTKKVRLSLAPLPSGINSNHDGKFRIWRVRQWIKLHHTLGLTCWPSTFEMFEVVEMSL